MCLVSRTYHHRGINMLFGMGFTHVATVERDFCRVLFVSVFVGDVFFIVVFLCIGVCMLWLSVSVCMCPCVCVSVSLCVYVSLRL